jgi:hypothetical protein
VGENRFEAYDLENQLIGTFSTSIMAALAHDTVRYTLIFPNLPLMQSRLSQYPLLQHRRYGFSPRMGPTAMTS